MIDLNELTRDQLVEKLASLRPGEAMRTADDIIIRRVRNLAGFEFVSGVGVPDPRKHVSAESTADAAFTRSANSTHKMAFGGEIRYISLKAAREVLETGRAIEGRHFTKGQMSQDAADRILSRLIARIPWETGADKVAMEQQASAASSALEKLIKGASLPSYKSRARLAAGSLTKGDVASARAHLEALIVHAERSSAGKDAQLATQALLAVRDAHPNEAAKPVPTEDRYTVRRNDEGYQLYAGGQPYGDAFSSRSAADSRRRFLNRTARQRAGADEIDAQERGETVVRKVQREEEEAA